VGTLIVGSTAQYYWFPAVSREPKDFDIFSDLPEKVRVAVLGMSTENFWHPNFEQWITPATHRHASVDELYTIKISHSYWELKNGSWDKHTGDILFLESMGAAYLPWLHGILYPVWEDRYGKKQMNLKQEAANFFKDKVKRVYDHDSIHDSVAYGDEAMYTRVLKDGETVDIDPVKLWDQLTFDEQVMLFREEINATALERLVIPSGYRCSPGRAYRWALRRTVTSLTKGRSATFIMTNLSSFIHPDDYVSRHKSKLDKLISLREG